jgi:hypothetical protein
LCFCEFGLFHINHLKLKIYSQLSSGRYLGELTKVETTLLKYKPIKPNRFTSYPNQFMCFTNQFIIFNNQFGRNVIGVCKTTGRLLIFVSQFGFEVNWVTIFTSHLANQ